MILDMDKYRERKGLKKVIKIEDLILSDRVKAIKESVARIEKLTQELRALAKNKEDFNK